MSRSHSLLSSTVLHAAVIVVACVGWAAYPGSTTQRTRIVFLPSEAAPPPSPDLAVEVPVIVEPVATELPDPPLLAERAFEPFEPPERRAMIEAWQPAADPRDPFVRVVPPAPPVAPTAIAAPTEAAAFVEARALDAENQPPAYPPLAVRRGWSGVVTLEVAIDASGAVTAVSVTGSSGHQILDHAAEQAARAWRFAPARRGEVAVASALRLPVEFRLVD